MSSEFKTFCHPYLSCVFKMHTGETRQALLDGSEFLQFSGPDRRRAPDKKGY